MAQPDHPDRIVLHVAGTDRPGVTARLTEVIAAENAHLVTMGQSALHGYLMLSAIVDIPPGSNALRMLLFAVAELGLRLEVSAFRPRASTPRAAAPSALCVTMLGPLSDGGAPARITRFMADRQMNTSEQLAELRGELLRIGVELHVDLAVQKDDLFRKNKRLVCMDVDSTFVRGEFIDELAALAGCKPEVAAITERAMRGEIDFKQALTERVKLLEGLPMERVMTLSQKFELTPGAQSFVRVLRSLGYRVGLVSGGFDVFVDELRQRFGLDFAFANELEAKDGVLTGRVKGTIVDGERKAQVLRDMAKVNNFRIEQTVAVGDGANDMLMLQSAGLGIAFRAKPKLQEVADMSLNHNERLDTLLYLMGFNARDLRELG
jgi:phosphoserine phosphatase